MYRPKHVSTGRYVCRAMKSSAAVFASNPAGHSLPGKFDFSRGRQLGMTVVHNSVTVAYLIDCPEITFTSTVGPTLKLIPTNFIGCGSNGYVVRYAVEEHASADFRDSFYIVKIEKPLSQTEHTVIKELTNVTCGQIDARVIGSNVVRVHVSYTYRGNVEREDKSDMQCAFSLLQNADGDLLKFKETIDNFCQEHSWDRRYLSLAIVEKIRRQVICLLENNPRHVYADLKLANVLYLYHEDGISIHLGDLGSLQADPDGRHAMSIPCGRAPFQRLSGNVPRASQCLAHVLGLILAELMGADIGEFYHNMVVKAPNEAYFISITSELQDFLKINLPEDAKALAGLLSTDPAQRLDILSPIWSSKNDTCSFIPFSQAEPWGCILS